MRVFDQIWQMGNFDSFVQILDLPPLLMFSVAFSYYLFSNFHNPKIKANNIGVFHIQEDKYTLVAGFKARAGYI